LLMMTSLFLECQLQQHYQKIPTSIWVFLHYSTYCSISTTCIVCKTDVDRLWDIF
jgi:hypothetical protein